MMASKDCSDSECRELVDHKALRLGLDFLISEFFKCS